MKPLDFDEVILRIRHLMRHKELEYENKFLRDQIDQKYNFNFIIGESPAMRNVYHMIERIAKTITSVLITGRSGTGKELIARAIHANSDRSDKPFIPVNCGAIPENLFESELFGYRKGAFSGADSNKDGVFKSASGGTLFLDEIGDLPENVQVKLLRAIQEKEIRPLGANSAINVDVRLISATNKNLEKEVEEGRFREDLYYRLNIIELNVPELSERKEDIPLLVSYFIDKYNREFHREIKGVNNEVMKILMLYKWKGQVRELENVIERAVLLANEDYIIPSDLPSSMKSDDNISDYNTETDDLNEALAAYERNHIINVLKRTGGNRTETARILGIDPSTLSRKMTKLEIKNDNGDS
jgi:transcriptional regulator with PAS, ATPase and Fis domain